MISKKQALMGLGGAAMVAALALSSSTSVGADSKRPPKAAVEKMKKGLDNPTADGGGQGDPTKASGALLALRDPETGFVLRDEKGLPRVLSDANGKPVEVQPQDVPAEQRLAQGRNEERQKRAGKGDVHAQREILDEAQKTRDAVVKHVPGANASDLPPLPPRP